MAVEIRMPALGQTTDEVRLIEWLVQEGEEVRRGDSICEVENDKSVMPLESAGSGILLKKLVGNDTVVSAGTVIALLGEKGESLPELESISPGQTERPGSSSGEAKGAPGQPQSTTAGEASGPEASVEDAGEENVRATHLVRNLASKHGVKLSVLRGSGPRGLITRADLQAHLDHGGRGSELHGENVKPGETVSQTVHQQAVARALSRSKTEIPHYYLSATVEADSVLSWRETHLRPDGSRISFYALFARAAAEALKRHQRVNATHVNGRLRQQRSIHLGIAVAVGDELYVPVLRDAGGRDILELDGEVRSLVDACRNGELPPGAESGGTITVSNLGMYAVDEFCPIINSPQAAILGFGRIRKQLHVDEEASMRVRSVLTVTGSFDHRIINGAQGAAFLTEFKRILEEEL